jgi:hypothetical protein
VSYELNLRGTTFPFPQTRGAAAAALSAGTIFLEYAMPMMALPGSWDTDARLRLRAVAPRPATVAAAVISVQTNERAG